MFNLYCTVSNTRTTAFIRFLVFLQIVCILFCLLQNECSTYSSQTSSRYSKNSYLDSAHLFWHHYADKLKKSHLHIEIFGGKITFIWVREFCKSRLFLMFSFCISIDELINCWNHMLWYWCWTGLCFCLFRWVKVSEMGVFSVGKNSFVTSLGCDCIRCVLVEPEVNSSLGWEGGRVILPPCWFSLNNLGTVKAVILAFCRIQ